VKLKPGSALNEQTYGLQFVDAYVPYYHMGVCYLKLGDDVNALEMFKKEEARGVIKRSSLNKEMARLQEEARNVQGARKTREMRQEIQRLLKEGDDLAKKRAFPEALAKLAQAEVGAKGLDPEVLRAVTDLQNRIRATEEELQRATAKALRIEQRMADGGRLLEEGRSSEAQVAFDDVLALDPQNPRAAEGRRTAQERITASQTRQDQARAYETGKALYEQGQYEAALVPLTDASADLQNLQAQDLLKKARAVLEGMRKAKEQQAEIDKLFAKGERQLASGRFPEAAVAFQGVLRLDKGNSRAQERLTTAERRTAEVFLARYLPNREPDLYLSWPDRPEVESPTLTVRGRAFDDWGIAKVELRVGGKVVAELAPPPRLDTGEPQRMVDIDRELQLEPGPNEVVVTAIDSSGLQRTEMHQVTRRLRFYETALFVPSAAATAVGLLGTGLVVQHVRRRRAIRRRFNPYIAGAPVLEDEMFFGRQKLTQRLLNVLHHNSLMITGERRIGKTTFLYHLKKVLTADEGSDYRFFPVFVDLQGVPEQGFFHALMSDVVEALGLSPATRQSLRFLPQPDSYDGRDFSHDLQRVIEELKSRTDKKVKLALLIDEVDVLNEYSERINQRLRSIFMKTFSENLVAVMSGVGVKRTWNSEVSPWYNFFDEIEIAGFSRDEAEALIKRPVAGVFRYQPEAVERILALSQLKPYLLQKFCVHAVNRMLEDGRTTVRSTDVEAARQAVMFEGSLGAAEPAEAPTHVSA
jgi:tetratricopeptide (TPR) repeat protein